MSLTISLLFDACPKCGRGEEVYWANITHNLTQMATEAGIYEMLWRPGESGIKRAKQLISPLRKAVEEMKADPERFEKFDSPNGWGLYKNFLPWLERLLNACEQYPDASIEVSV